MYEIIKELGFIYMDYSYIRIVVRNAVSSDYGRPEERGII